jgi:hypothetical protein
MKRKIIMAIVGSFLVSGLLGPPDAVSQTVYGLAGAMLCATLLVLSRWESVKSSPKQMQTLVCVLVFVISILTVTCQISWQRINDLQTRMTTLHAEGLQAAQAGQ